MKRLVSIITALALTLALLPATLATASVADDTIVFDFGARASGSGNLTIPVDGSKTASEVFSADVTGNGWSAFVYSETAESINSTGTTNKTLQQSKGSYMNLNFNANESWIAFLLPVEEIGNTASAYDATFTTDETNKKRMNYGGHNFYFIPISDEKLAELTDDAKKRAYVDEKLVDDTYYMTKTPYVAQDAYQITEFEFEIKESTDESPNYLFVIKWDKDVAAYGSTFYMCSLELKKQPDVYGEVLPEIKLYTPKTTGGNVGNAEVQTVQAGVPVTVSATPDENYEFVCWSDSNGAVVSVNKNYSFTPYSNTVLYAQFRSTLAEDKKIGVDFYDADKDYLGFVEVSAGTSFGTVTAPTPEMTGYTFTGDWAIDEETVMADTDVINERISVVAVYSETGNSVLPSQDAGVYFNYINSSKGISYNRFNSADTSSPYFYGDTVDRTISADRGNVTQWLRDGKILYYGNSFEYLVWDPTVITFSSMPVVSQNPIVYLDDPANGAYMIEYDEGDGTALEAGLIFGKTAEITVSDCYTKAKTKEAKAHGQFTAKPAAENVTEGMQTYVRGYLIYRDTENTIRVIYTDAAKITE